MSIDFAFMDKMLALHADEYEKETRLWYLCLSRSSMDVVVQPSMPWMTLNEQVKSEGLFFPVDPSPTVRRSNISWRALVLII